MELRADQAVDPTAHVRGRRRWRLAALGLVVTGIVVTIHNALDIARVHQLEVQSRPDPPFGEWFVHSGSDIAHVGLEAIGLGVAVALPALAVVIVLGRRTGVSASRVGAAALVAMILMGINLGRIQDAIVGLVGLVPPTSDVNPRTLLLTPIVEELLMLLAVAIVMLAAPRRSGARAGLVLGLAAGIGATITEAALYVQLDFLLSGDPPYGDVLALRFALFGLNVHATTAAVSGAALGAWLVPPIRARRIWIAIAGFAGAVLIHGLWNLLVSDIATVAINVLAGSSGERGVSTVFIGSSVAATILLIVPWIVLAATWRRSVGTRGDDQERSLAL